MKRLGHKDARSSPSSRIISEIDREGKYRLIAIPYMFIYLLNKVEFLQLQAYM